MVVPSPHPSFPHKEHFFREFQRAKLTLDHRPNGSSRDEIEADAKAPEKEKAPSRGSEYVSWNTKARGRRKLSQEVMNVLLTPLLIHDMLMIGCSSSYRFSNSET